MTRTAAVFLNDDDTYTALDGCTLALMTEEERSVEDDGDDLELANIAVRLDFTRLLEVLVGIALGEARLEPGSDLHRELLMLKEALAP
jgi:hypothetical protein